MDNNIFSSYASSPPLWEKFSSSFRFIQFSNWTVEILNISKNIKKEGLDTYLQNLHILDSFGQKRYGIKSLNI